MPTLRFKGVRFAAYVNDHPPRHVHGYYGEVSVIVNLYEDYSVGLAGRKDAIKPPNAKQNAVNKVLRVAAEHYDELVALWEEVRAKSKS